MLEARKKWQMIATLWLKAEGVESLMIPCESAWHAMQLRRNLYAAIRRARKTRFFNQQLLDIAAQYSVTIKESNVIIYKRTLPDYIEESAGEVNAQGTIVSSDESFAKLAKLLEG